MTGQKFSVVDIFECLKQGWRTFRCIPVPSMAYALIFTGTGFVLLAAVHHYGLAPMALPLVGGFMLIGPVILSGFFKLADQHHAQSQVRLSAALLALVHAPTSVWVIALFCSFLFLIWITDAATLYSFMIGGEHLPYQLPWQVTVPENVLLFELFGSLMGAVLAFAILAVSAFSVPLLYQNRAKLTVAVGMSVKAIFSNFLTSICWGLLLTLLTFISILLLPLLTVTLPVLAYASYELYKKVFPVSAM